MGAKRFGGKVCLVTGAGSGIGKSVALRMAREGGRLVLVGRDTTELEAVAREIQEAGGESMIVGADVSQEQEVAEGFRRVAAEWNAIDVVVANAGVNGSWAPLDELEVSEFRQTLDINLVGTFITIQEAVRHMPESGGSVVVMSSVNGTRMFSNSGATAYACSKAGQVALTKMLALELAKHKIRVNAICPGAIETPIHDKTERRDLEEAQEPVEFPEGSIPLTDGAPGAPEEVASVTSFLASDEARHVTGAIVFVDGGQSLLQG